jgi:glycosyl hydrolase family 100 (putative invertase)
LDLIETAAQGAVEALRRCSTPLGLKASGQAAGHQQIWARDSMIAGLGGQLAGDETVQRAIHASISLLGEHRAPNGAVPNNIDPSSMRPNFRAYADGGLWWIILSSLLAPDPAGVHSLLQWYECQDVDQSGLLSMQESADWQDLFCTRGKGLYLNCLYVLALRAAARLFQRTDAERAERCRTRAERVAAAVNSWFWYTGDGNLLRHIAHTFSTENRADRDSLGRKRWIPQKRYLLTEQYYLPYLGFRAAGEWFDTLGNVLAILAGVAGDSQTAHILDFVCKHRLDEFPARSLTPAVQPGDPDWRDYYGMLNTPHHYHNGGIWPFIGGFYVAALVAAGRQPNATAVLHRLAQLNQRGEFNEWHHGQTGEPMGARDQAWSAGMFLFARDCVHRAAVTLLPGEPPAERS